MSALLVEAKQCQVEQNAHSLDSSDTHGTEQSRFLMSFLATVRARPVVMVVRVIFINPT